MQSTDEPKFLQRDWFSWNIPHWQSILEEFAGKPDLQFLEIGVFEGRSTLWLLDNILTAPGVKLVCIDNFLSDPETKVSQDDSTTAKDTFLHNTRKYGAKVDLRVGDSQEVLRLLPLNTFDFVYVDGSHRAANVLEDAVLSFRLLKLGGIMFFDDYGWGFNQGTLLHPKPGIDAFLEVFADQVEVLFKKYQVGIRKVEAPQD